MSQGEDAAPRAIPCGHAQTQEIYGGLLRRCADCGLAVTSRAPRFDYAESYFVGEQSHGYDFESAFSTALDESRFTQELDRIEAEGLRGSLLDIGCATGHFLAIARARGWEIAGVELSAFARARAHERTGVPIFESLADLEPGRRFDVVTLHHVLEHIEGPVEFLRDEVRPLIRHLLVIEVPNFASLASRAHGPRWRDLRPEQHLTHFTPESLEHCVRVAGFRVRRVQTLWGPLWSLRSSLEMMRLLPALLHRRHREDIAPGPIAAEADVSRWTPPSGWKQIATEASRLAFAPIVRALENARLAERLALEAEPETH